MSHLALCISYLGKKKAQRFLLLFICGNITSKGFYFVVEHAYTMVAIEKCDFITLEGWHF